MINEYVIEGKCLFEPFTDVDGHKRLYVQLNINSNRGLVYTRSYNPKLINSIMKEARFYENGNIILYRDGGDTRWIDYQCYSRKWIFK